MANIFHNFFRRPFSPYMHTYNDVFLIYSQTYNQVQMWMCTLNIKKQCVSNSESHWSRIERSEQFVSNMKKMQQQPPQLGTMTLIIQREHISPWITSIHHCLMFDDKKKIWLMLTYCSIFSKRSRCPLFWRCTLAIGINQPTAFQPRGISKNNDFMLKNIVW